MHKKILLVDDDEEEFDILKMALEMAALDHRCYWASSLAEATRLTQDIQPDFVFIDINMPRHDGFQCLQRLKLLPTLHDTVFVMYSTHISEANQQTAMQLGASCCILKPVNLSLLLKQLLRLFEDKASAP